MQDRSRGWLRPAAFAALGALVLHQARYLVGHGERAGEALARDGHAHLGVALPLVLLLVTALVVSAPLAAAAGRRRRARGAVDARVRTLAFALVVLAAFCLQEVGQGALSASHPGGLDALVGHGGIAALPLAVAIGCALSLLAGAVGAAELRLAASLGRRRLDCAGAPPARHDEPDSVSLVSMGLVFGFARRPPPSLATGV